MTEKKSIGIVSLAEDGGLGTRREIPIVDMVRSVFKDHRMCTVARTEENTFLLSVENPESTGRWPKADMYLSEESMLALFGAVCLFYTHYDIDVNEKVKELVGKDTLSYEFSSIND